LDFQQSGEDLQQKKCVRGDAKEPASFSKHRKFRFCAELVFSFSMFDLSYVFQHEPEAVD